MFITYVRSTFITDQSNFIGNCQYGKQIGKILDIENRQKKSPGPKAHFLGLESEKSGNQVPYFESFEKYLKFAHKIYVQNGLYAFPNELMRFRVEAKPIWEKIQKHFKNAVII